MDLDFARRQIQEAKMWPLSDVVLDLMTLVGRMDDATARLEKRVEELESMNERIIEVVNASGSLKV